ncbi:MAG: hypothetical protein LUG83_05680 [Lachnospiraceae bacterium]|nr:hypothetical protein [Lachnospiraceae bacterium]
MISPDLVLVEQYMPYAIVDDDEQVIGWVEGTPMSAKKAAKTHIEMHRKFDDISNYEYWDNLMEKLGLTDI